MNSTCLGASVIVLDAVGYHVKFLDPVHDYLIHNYAGVFAMIM